MTIRNYRTLSTPQTCNVNNKYCATWRAPQSKIAAGASVAETATQRVVLVAVLHRFQH